MGFEKRGKKIIKNKINNKKKTGKREKGLPPLINAYKTFLTHMGFWMWVLHM